MAETPSISESVNRKIDDEPYDFSGFDIKPKVKLGPRPVATGERTKRQVASIAAIPANFRPVQKKSEPSRQQPYAPVSAPSPLAMPVLPRPPPIPDTPEYNPRPVSRGSVKSLPSHKSTTMTPDKIRLMKAVELRKKQLRKSNPQPTTFVPPKDDDAPAVPAIPKQLEVLRTEEFRRVHEKDTEPETYIEVAPHTASKKPDSGIEMNYEDPEKRGSAQQQHVEEPRPPSADEATLAQLQPAPQQAEKPSRQTFEPTVSMEMLEDTPMTTGPRIDYALERRQPDLRLPEGFDRPRPVSPTASQSQREEVRTLHAEVSPISPDNAMTGSGTLEPPGVSAANACNASGALAIGGYATARWS
ncbi:hypothetical protein B0A55_07477 [Friedmanniomyces simplex]|uniref:Uncharacterized protein n=1 Tax=Friedmanniomyces simplex TaxID=329884 RepID=A0A4U0WYN8_9PEZI|nr:hypothetical protein B0A55_07477 [Friedmanniomyces simplex]